MTHGKQTPTPRSEVAMWHELSGQPDNVTDDGVVVPYDAGRRLQAEKQLLRRAIENLSTNQRSPEVRNLARLAASYLVAGDVETARRYVNRASELLHESETRLYRPPE